MVFGGACIYKCGAVFGHITCIRFELAITVRKESKDMAGVGTRDGNHRWQVHLIDLWERGRFVCNQSQRRSGVLLGWLCFPLDVLDLGCSLVIIHK